MATKMQTERDTNAAFFADLVRCETRLYNQFNDELRAEHGIVTSQFEFLRYIREHDDARTTDIAAEFAIGVGAVSKAMDRLEARGFVVRIPNPANRRSSILTLTDDGRTLIDGAANSFHSRLAEIFAGIASPGQFAAAAALLASLRAALERDGLGTPTG